MKYLTLVRHAKSSWKHDDLSDRDRPLNKRGKRDAPIMGQRLAHRDCVPSLVLSSPAVRALATAKILADAVGYGSERVVVDKRIYEADVSTLLGVLRETEAHIEHVMLVGHNPAVTGLINRYSSQELDNLPTCGVARFRLDIDEWTKLGPDDPVAEQVEIDYPKKRRSGPSETPTGV